MLLSELFEGVNDLVVYHGTTALNAEMILFKNSIEARTNHWASSLGLAGSNRANKGLSVEGDHIIDGVSTSRNLSFALGYGGEVAFVLDLSRLRQSFKIVPIDFLNHSSTRKLGRQREESEEFIVTKKGINPLDRYLKEIIIHHSLEDEYADDERMAILFRHPLLKII